MVLAQFGDLSVEVDKNVKAAVADFCGKETYVAGDLSKEVDKRIKERVNAFTGKEQYKVADRRLEGKRRAQQLMSLLLHLIPRAHLAHSLGTSRRRSSADGSNGCKATCRRATTSSAT